MTTMLVVFAALGGILLFMLAAASANTPLFAEHYRTLLVLNGVIAATLLVLVIYQLVQLARQRRARIFGSLLTFRILVMFAIIAVLPGAIVYTVSVQFLSRSIESWFDVRVDRALEGGLNLGRVALEAMLSDLVLRSNVVAVDLSGLPASLQPTALARLREQVGVQDLLLLSASGKVLGSASLDSKLIPSMPSAQALRQARTARGYGAVEPLGEKGLVLRVVVPLSSLSIAGEMRLLQITQQVPQALADYGENAQAGYAANQERSLSRAALRNIYIVTLTLTLLLALFSAIGFAFLLSRRLSQPLAVLAEGTQAVARGDFSRRASVTSRDELGILTQSFNSMTEQLDQARRAAEANRAQLETANAYLESILGNLSAGVLVFDRDMLLSTANRAAAVILHGELSTLVGLPIDQWNKLREFADAIREEFEKPRADSWQRQLEVLEHVILARGSALPAASGGGYVVVFDDITQLIAAQRAMAWAEVARRLAHEIKNPLTPIQLSAERLQAKLSGRLSAEDSQSLDRATETIVTQVTALKNMVNDFREYARNPSPSLEPLDINKLVSEVLRLYEESGTHFLVRLAPELPSVRGDRDRLRQVIHNLLQNSQDALAGAASPRIDVVTALVPDSDGGKVSLMIGDNGCGFPDAIMQRAFEPYVTTKTKGTGLGLAIVKRIIDEHNGTVNIFNRQDVEGGNGAAVSISLPLARAA